MGGYNTCDFQNRDDVLVDRTFEKRCWTKCRLSENGDWLQRAAMTQYCNEILYRALVPVPVFAVTDAKTAKNANRRLTTGVVFSTAKPLSPTLPNSTRNGPRTVLSRKRGGNPVRSASVRHIEPGTGTGLVLRVPVPALLIVWIRPGARLGHGGRRLHARGVPPAGRTRRRDNPQPRLRPDRRNPTEQS